MYSAAFVTYFPQRPILGDNCRYIFTGYDYLRNHKDV
nr:MAG TPA: hypothetical protein [Bacteriophage sp.]